MNNHSYNDKSSAYKITGIASTCVALVIGIPFALSVATYSAATAIRQSPSSARASEKTRSLLYQYSPYLPALLTDEGPHVINSLLERITL